MFIGFHMPAVTRHTKAFLLWVFYRQITHLAPDELALICNSHYLDSDYKGWEHYEHIQSQHDYVVPSAARISEYEIHLISPEIFQEIDADDGYIAAWKHLLTERFEPLERRLSEIISQIMQRRKVEAILTWSNTASLSYVAAQHGLPVIHGELGTLRHPHYISTAYFDFSGVNGNTECERRYAAYRSEAKNHPLPDLPREALLDVVRSSPKLPQEDAQPTFAVGVAKQVAMDSNIVAFSGGWNAEKLVDHALDRFGNGNVLVRKHPGEPEDDRHDANLVKDTSATAIEFLAKCNQVMTINSSVGFEAMLYGKKTTILGDNPFRFIADLPPEAELERRTALNFAVFGYLVPYRMIYKSDYLRWRLSRPSETAIVQYHLGYWLTEKSRRLVESLGENARLAAERVQGQEIQQQQWESRILELESACRSRQAAHQAILPSRSWKITAPVRWIGDRLRYLKNLFRGGLR
jgi:hypothetical protein